MNASFVPFLPPLLFAGSVYATALLILKLRDTMPVPNLQIFAQAGTSLLLAVAAGIWIRAAVDATSLPAMAVMIVFASAVGIAVAVIRYRAYFVSFWRPNK